MSLIAFKHQWGNRALVDLFNNAFHKNALLDKQKLIKDLTELAHKLVYQDPDKKLWRIFSLKGDNLDVQTSQGNFELAKDIQQWYKNRESQEELNTLCRKWGIPDIIMLDIVGQRISPTFQVK